MGIHIYETLIAHHYIIKLEVIQKIIDRYGKQAEI